MGTLTKHLAGTEFDHDQSRHAGGSQRSDDYPQLARLSADQDIERRAFSGVYSGDLSWFPSEMLNDYGITVTEADARAFVDELRAEARKPYERRGLEHVYVWRGGHNPNADYGSPVSSVVADSINLSGVSVSEALAGRAANEYGDASEYGDVALYRVPLRGLEMDAHFSVPGEVLVNPAMLELVGTVTKHLQGTEFDHDQSRHAGSRGKAGWVGQTDLTDEQRSTQPAFLAGTTWTEATRYGPNGGRLAISAVFTDEYLASLGVDLDAKYGNAEDTRVEILQRPAVYGGRVFYDPVNGLVAIVRDEAFDVEEFQRLGDRYDGPDPQAMSRAVSAAIDEWFIRGMPREGETINERGERRVKEILDTAVALQKAAPIGPTVIRIEPPTNAEFIKTEEGPDGQKVTKVAWAEGLYYKPHASTRTVGDTSYRKQTVQTIALSMLNRFDEGYWTAEPSSSEERQFSPYFSTLVHEWGHAIGFQSGRSDARRGELFYDYKRLPSTNVDAFVTEYGLTNSYEMEAEAFSSWFMYKNGLDGTGKYKYAAQFAEDSLGVSAKPVEFITVDGVAIPVVKRAGVVGIRCSMDPREGSLFVYADGTTKVVNELAAVVKHFLGTEHDHDQSSHAGGRGKASLDSIAKRALDNAGKRKQLPRELLEDGDLIVWGREPTEGPLKPPGAAKVMSAQGWDEPSQRVTTEQFDALAESGDFTVVYRGGPKGLSNGMVNGTPYIGTGDDGAGMYVTTSAKRAGMYGMRVDGTDPSTYVVRMLVPNSMIREAEASQQPPAYIHPPIGWARWALDGQGAFFSKTDKDGSYQDYVILNTSALIVSHETRIGREEFQSWVRGEQPVVFKASDLFESGPYFAVVDGEAVLVEFDGGVTKHFQGTEHDHDQSTHGRGRGGTVKVTDGYENVAEVSQWLGLRRSDASDVKKAVVSDLATALDDVSTEALLGFLMDHHGAVAGFDDYNLNDTLSVYLLQEGGSPRGGVFDDIYGFLIEDLKALDSMTFTSEDERIAWQEPDGKDPDILVTFDANEGRIAQMDFASSPADRARLAAYRDAIDRLQRQTNYAVEDVAIWSAGDGLGWRFDEMREHVADVAIAAWAETSNLSVQSQALQEAVREEFGLTVERYRSPRESLPAMYVLATEGQSQSHASEFYEAHKDIYQRLVRHQYERTQQFIRDVYGEDVTHVRLWRGQNWASAIQSESEGRLFPVDVAATNPLSSWSSDPKTALQFARWGIRTDPDGRFASVESIVPVARIFSTPASGAGALNEFEHTVLGGNLGIEAVIDVRLTEQRVIGADAKTRIEQVPSYWVTLPSGQVIPLEDYKPQPFAKHFQGTEHDHDQSTHGRGRSGAGAVNVQKHDPELFTNLAASLGLPVNMTFEEAAYRIQGPTAKDFILSEIASRLKSGELVDDVLFGPGKMGYYEELYGKGSDEYYKALAVEMDAQFRAQMQGVTVRSVEEAAQLSVMEAMLPDLVRQAIEQGKLDIGAIETQLAGAVDRSAAKIMAQNAVAERMGGVATADLVAASSALFLEYTGVQYSTRDAANIEALVEYDPKNNKYFVMTRFADREAGKGMMDLREEDAKEFFGGSVRGLLSDPVVAAEFDKALQAMTARELINQWSTTSNKSPASATIQRAAAAEFGLDRAAEPGEPLDNPALDRVARAFVRAQYEATQKMLAEQLPEATHIRLFRGGDSGARYTDEPDEVPNTWEEGTLRLRPLASFSTAPSIANLFGTGSNALHFAADVPVERILSTPFTGNGASIEAEFVVIGGPIHGLRQAQSIRRDGSKWAVPDNLPLGATEFVMIDGQPVPIGKSVAKHFQGTEHDHDQSSHGRGRGKAASTANTSNTLDDEMLFNRVEAILQRSWTQAEALGLRPVTSTQGGGYAGGHKHRIALDLADRLAEMDVDPNALLALALNKDMNAYNPVVILVDSAIAVGGEDVSEYSSQIIAYYENPAAADDFPADAAKASSEAMGRNWAALEATLLSAEGLPADIDVFARQDPDGRWGVGLTRDPQAVLSSEGTVLIRENGTWSDNAVKVLGYATSDNLIRSWARSATGRDADAFAAAAIEELGAPIATSQSPDWSGILTKPGPYYDASGPAHEARKAIARAMYENTQDQLKTLFPEADSFVLYRGAAFSDLANEAEQSLIAGTTRDTTAMYERAHKPLSSWSASSATATAFVTDETEFVAAAIVPRERIFSTAFTGNGAFNESEFVVLGGRMPVAVRTDDEFMINVAPAYLRARLANETVAADEFITINGQPVPVFKHFQGTEHDHDQSTHAGGRGKGGGVLRYDPPDSDDIEERWAYQRQFYDSILEGPLGSRPGMSGESEESQSWMRQRNIYVAGKDGNEDIVVVVNRALRAGEVTPTGAVGGNQWQRVRVFDDMVNSTAKRDFQVFRSAVLTQEQVDSLRAGTEFVDPGFQSSDLKESMAMMYGFRRWAHGGRDQRGMRDGVPVLFRMVVKKGTGAVDVSYGEIVIQRNARVRVMSDPKVGEPYKMDGKRAQEYDYWGNPDSGIVSSPNFVVVDVEVSR